MIRILAKKAFRFTHPGFNALSKPKGPETTEDMQRRIISDQQRMFHTAQKKEISKMYFDTTPNEIQDAPDWIKEDELFTWALADGDIVELKSKAETVKPGTLAAVAEAAGEEVVEENVNGNMTNEETAGAAGGPVARRKLMGERKKKAADGE